MAEVKLILSSVTTGASAYLKRWIWNDYTRREVPLHPILEKHLDIFDASGVLEPASLLRARRKAAE